MINKVVGFLRNVGEASEQHIITHKLPGAWSFYCQGPCNRYYGIHEVSEEAMRAKAEKYGFRPHGESFICEDCLAYQDAASRYGEVTFAEAKYALTSEAYPSNRVFPGWFGDVAEGDEYVSEWECPAIDARGNTYTVRWHFDAIKGAEPDDASSWPWDGYIVSVTAR